jgi:hypothetical protein
MTPRNSPRFEHRQTPHGEIEEAPFPRSELKPDLIQNLNLPEIYHYDLLPPFSEVSWHWLHMQSESFDSDLVSASMHEINESRL